MVTINISYSINWSTVHKQLANQVFEHTNTKSELYHGKKITYHAPFDKCDRVEDYKVAWEHFEKIFKNTNNNNGHESKI